MNNNKNALKSVKKRFQQLMFYFYKKIIKYVKPTNIYFFFLTKLFKSFKYEFRGKFA